MEFRIQKSEFLRGLRLAQGIADRKSTTPLLGNVLLRVRSATELLCGATDLNVSLSAELRVTKATEGALTLSAKSLHDIVANLPGNELSLKQLDNNRAEIRAGKVKFTLTGQSDRDFPRLADHREVQFHDVDATVLREMIDRTLFAVCNDETRFHLNGVLFESVGSTARMVSTDGHRLSKVDRPLSGPRLQTGVIVPKKGVLEIKKLIDGADAVKLGIKTPFLFLAIDDMTLAVKLVDAQYPPYMQVIPTVHKSSAVVDRAMFIGAIKRAHVMSGDVRSIKLAFDKGAITVTSVDPDSGDVTEDLDAEYTGKAIAVGFNPRYILDILGQTQSEKVSVELCSELDPVIVRPIAGDDFVGVIMPMRT